MTLGSYYFPIEYPLLGAFQSLRSLYIKRTLTHFPHPKRIAKSLLQLNGAVLKSLKLVFDGAESIFYRNMLEDDFSPEEKLLEGNPLYSSEAPNEDDTRLGKTIWNLNAVFKELKTFYLKDTAGGTKWHAGDLARLPRTLTSLTLLTEREDGQVTHWRDISTLPPKLEILNVNTKRLLPAVVTQLPSSITQLIIPSTVEWHTAILTTDSVANKLTEFTAVPSALVSPTSLEKMVNLTQFNLSCYNQRLSFDLAQCVLPAKVSSISLQLDKQEDLTANVIRTWLPRSLTTLYAYYVDYSSINAMDWPPQLTSLTSASSKVLSSEFYRLPRTLTHLSIAPCYIKSEIRHAPIEGLDADGEGKGIVDHLEAQGRAILATADAKRFAKLREESKRGLIAPSIIESIEKGKTWGLPLLLKTAWITPHAITVQENKSVQFALPYLTHVSTHVTRVENEIETVLENLPSGLQLLKIEAENPPRPPSDDTVVSSWKLAAPPVRDWPHEKFAPSYLATIESHSVPFDPKDFKYLPRTLTKLYSSSAARLKATREDLANLPPALVCLCSSFSRPEDDETLWLSLLPRGITLLHLCHATVEGEDFKNFPRRLQALSAYHALNVDIEHIQELPRTLLTVSMSMGERQKPKKAVFLKLGTSGPMRLVTDQGKYDTKYLEFMQHVLPPNMELGRCNLGKPFAILDFRRRRIAGKSKTDPTIFNRHTPRWEHRHTMQLMKAALEQQNNAQPQNEGKN